jgi:dihydropteroate synthase
VSASKPLERLGGSIAADIMAFLKGAAIIRTHDVADTVQALRVAVAIRDAP